MIQVGTNSEIIFGGQPTGYGVSQEDNATRVYQLDGSRSGIGMPRSRYSLSHDMPSSGVAGRAEFERDFCAVTGREIPESTLAKLADLLSGHPDEALSTWTKEASSAALAEGWCLSECSGNSVEIQCQKVDSPEDSAAELGFTPPTLEDDGVAFSLLVGGVAPHHVLARQILEEYSPKEWSHICQVVAKINVDALEKSRLSADDIAREKGPYAFVDAKIDQSLLGKVLAVTGSHVVLSLGRSAAIVAQSDLSRVPVLGEDATIVFKDGKGLVADFVHSQGVDKGR